MPSTGRIESVGDSSLVAAIGRGDDDALAEAYRRHGGPAYGLALRVLHDSALAEDVVQEVFLNVWRYPERFAAERGSLRAYLLTQAHRRAVDLVRSGTARRRREEREGTPDVDESADVERQVWDLTVAQRVREAMDCLPDGERVAIELAYFGGLSYREVATVLEEPEGTIKSRIRLGLGRLRGSLVEVGVVEP